jgi:hypothetical protein
VSVPETGGAGTAMTLTKEEFITGYCRRSGISREKFDQRLVALPCQCDGDDCDGWAVVEQDLESQAVHRELYGPEEETT